MEQNVEQQDEEVESKKVGQVVNGVSIFIYSQEFSPRNSLLMQYKYLISKSVDPILAISIGTAAYYVHEYRHGRPQGHTLNELVTRWYNEGK